MGLVRTAIGRTLEQPAAAGIVILDPGVVTGGNTISTNLASHDVELIKLQVIVTEAAGNGSAAREILSHERTYDIVFEALFMIDHIVRNADVRGDAAGVIDVVE